MTVPGDAQATLPLDLVTALTGDYLLVPGLLDLACSRLQKDCGLTGAAVYTPGRRCGAVEPVALWGSAPDRRVLAAAVLAGVSAPGALALRRAGQTLGALVFTGSRMDRLRPEAAASLALHLADGLHMLALDREREFTEYAAGAIRRLFEEGSVAAGVEEAGEILARVTADLFRTERAGVHLVDEYGRIRYTVGVGVPQQLSDALARSLVGKMAHDSPVWRSTEAAGGPVFVEDVTQAAVRAGGFAQTLQVRSYVAMPLLSATGIVGMAMCGDHTGPRAWTATDREMARRLALQGALVVDSARLRQAERSHLAEVTHRALHDGLTGLPNRSLLMERLDRAVAVAAPAALLLLDLNGFKGVNDTLGHQTGDALLDQVADRLRWIVRDTDTVARLGGDEFAILVVGEPALAQAIAVRVHERLGEPFSIDGRPVQVGASVGIALYPLHAADPGTLLRHADAAMYEAKRYRSGPRMHAPSSAEAA
jgi:diguanylate cyclase (GGDEF)-like protein